MKNGYINRRAVLKLLDEMGGNATEQGTWEDGWDTAVDTIYNAVLDLPAVKVEQMRMKRSEEND